MAMGSAVQGNVVGARADRPVVSPVSLSSGYQVIGEAGIAAAADNGGNPITRPATQIIRAGTRPLGFAGAGGTHAGVRLKYPVGMTISQQLILNCFGRSLNQDWELRKNVQGLIDVQITASPSGDMISADGLWQYTYVDLGIHLWDRAGREELVFSVKQAFNGTGADPLLAVIEAMVI